MKIAYERNVEFFHYGVQGMKWGIRRYQNDDGSLTPLGRTRYGQKAVKEYHKSTKAQLAGKNKKAEKHMEKFKKIDESLPNPKSDELAEKVEKQSFFKKRNNKDARKLSDDELNSRLSRLKTESDYKKYMKSTRANEDVERGKEASKQVLEKVGKTTATAIGTSLAVYFGSRAIAKGLGITPPDPQFKDMFMYIKPDKK